MNFNLEQFLDLHIKSVFEDDFFEFIDVPVLRPFKRKVSTQKEGDYYGKVNSPTGNKTAQVGQVHH